MERPQRPADWQSTIFSSNRNPVAKKEIENKTPTANQGELGGRSVEQQYNLAIARAETAIMILKAEAAEFFDFADKFMLGGVTYLGDPPTATHVQFLHKVRHWRGCQGNSVGLWAGQYRESLKGKLMNGQGETIVTQWQSLARTILEKMKPFGLEGAFDHFCNTWYPFSVPLAFKVKHGLPETTEGNLDTAQQSLFVEFLFQEFSKINEKIEELKRNEDTDSLIALTKLVAEVLNADAQKSLLQSVQESLEKKVFYLLCASDDDLVTLIEPMSARLAAEGKSDINGYMLAKNIIKFLDQYKASLYARLLNIHSQGTKESVVEMINAMHDVLGTITLENFKAFIPTAIV